MRRRDEGDFEKIIFNMWFVGNGGMSKTSKTEFTTLFQESIQELG